MNACFLFDEAAWGLLEARFAVEALRPLLEIPSRMAPPGSATFEDEAVVFVGEPRSTPAGAAASVPVLPWPHWEPGEVQTVTFEDGPLLACGHCDGVPESEIQMPQDWLRAIAFVLLREEEFDEPHRDEWECFSGFSSRLHELGVLHFPLVNRWAAQLTRRIEAWCERRYVRPSRVPRWKDGAHFSVVLSHDVDWVRRYSLADAFRLLRQSRGPGSYAFRKGSSTLLETLSRGRTDDDPFWTFDRWVAEEAALGFRSTFYFCAPRPSRRDPFDPTYRMSDPVRFESSRITVQSLLRELEGRGFEVGVHGSYLSQRSAPELARQKQQVEQALERSVAGIRQHFLRFDIRETWAAQEGAGFVYDSTLGYNEVPGFRAGIAAPFHPWDPSSRTPRRLLELPLTAMDASLFRTLKLDGPLAARRLREHLEAVEACGGLAVLLWHPNATDVGQFPGWWQCYRETLAYLSTRPAWVTTGRDLARWWIDREARIEARC